MVGSSQLIISIILDNTDVHDEIVPKNLTTAHGGFYVNYGPLGTIHILRKHFF